MAGFVIFASPSDPWALLDGRGNAPSGTAPYSTLLNTYHSSTVSNGRYYWPSTTALSTSTGNYYQPQWRVAGVDYNVGYSSTTSLKIPVSSWPGGTPGDGVNFPACAKNFGNSFGYYTMLVDIDPVVLDGWDLSGWLVSVGDSASVSTVTMQNCKITISSAAGTGVMGNVVLNDVSGSVTIQNCTFDGNNGAICTDTNLGGGLLKLRTTRTSGTYNYTVKYCYFLNAPADIIDYGGISSGITQNFTFQYNMFRNAGAADPAFLDAHPDYFQGFWIGPVSGMTFNFNTVVQDIPCLQGGTQGVAFGSDGVGGSPSVTGPVSIQYNCVLGTANANTGQSSLGGMIFGMNAAGAQFGTGHSLTIASNYFDESGIHNSGNAATKPFIFVGSQPTNTTIGTNVRVTDAGTMTYSSSTLILA